MGLRFEPGPKTTCLRGGLPEIARTTIGAGFWPGQTSGQGKNCTRRHIPGQNCNFQRRSLRLVFEEFFVAKLLALSQGCLGRLELEIDQFRPCITFGQLCDMRGSLAH